jgi:hypothetical protein
METDVIPARAGRDRHPVPGYPYERLTSKETANIQRLRDEQMIKLRQEYREVADELYHTEKRLKQIMPILEEMGIDIDVILATKKVFAE